MCVFNTRISLDFLLRPSLVTGLYIYIYRERERDFLRKSYLDCQNYEYI